MYRCPFCENYSYDWNRKDSRANKDKLKDDINNHLIINHPEEMKPVSSRDPADNIAYIIPVLPPKGLELPTESEVIV